MPRQVRKQSVSSIYHIIIMGNERKDIFYDDNDRVKFLDTLHKIKEDGNYIIYAYCLMSNHVHLLIREGKDSIHRSMKRICVSYAYYFNNKYRRVGHLFQDRFRSEAIEGDSYMLAAARYIHNNPVKAGILTRAEDHKWSSYTDYISEIECVEGLVERGFLLSMLSDREERAKELLREYTNEPTIDEFIDCKNSEGKPESGSKTELIEVINKILVNHGQCFESLKRCKDKKVRNELIGEIKETTGASVRELSRIMGISKDIIFRA